MKRIGGSPREQMRAMGPGALALGLSLGLLVGLPSRPAHAASPAAQVAAPEVRQLFLPDLQKQFAADVGKLRLLLIFSPT